MLFMLGAALASPAIVTATTFSYYRSVFCDTQTSDFLIESYASPLSMQYDNLCHQTPAGTMGTKVTGELDSDCVILAYEDYGCANLIGSVPASGKCVASMTARIGSWQASCNESSTYSTESTISESMTFTPGELKRRGKTRLPVVRSEAMLTTTSAACTTEANDTKTASSIANEISSALSASAPGSAITTAPSAGAALSSAISSGTIVAEGYNLTSYVTGTSPVPSMTTSAVVGAGNGTNGSYVVPSVTTTATYTGKSNGNGTVALQHGSAVAVKTSNMLLGGVIVVLGFVFMM